MPAPAHCGPKRACFQGRGLTEAGAIPIIAMMAIRFTHRVSRSMRRFGLVVAALAMLLGPIGSVGHAEANDPAHQADSDHHAAPNSHCDGAQAGDVGAPTKASDAGSCHVVSSPLVVPVSSTLVLRLPHALRFVATEPRLPVGLAIPPPLGPPRSEA